MTWTWPSIRTQVTQPASSVAISRVSLSLITMMTCVLGREKQTAAASHVLKQNKTIQCSHFFRKCAMSVSCPLYREIFI